MGTTEHPRDAAGRRLYPLRITPTTVILVPKKKCTPEYAEWYRKNRMGINIKPTTLTR